MGFGGGRDGGVTTLLTIIVHTDPKGSHTRRVRPALRSVTRCVARQLLRRHHCVDLPLYPRGRMNKHLTLLTRAVACNLIISGVMSSSARALNSCELERPSQVVSFDNHASQVNSSHVSPSHGSPAQSPESSDPSILLRATSDTESLRLGVGGSITLKFTVPIANYPAAGALTVERPHAALSCSSYPVRAEVSGSADGVHFVPLGTTCQTASFDLGSFPWIAYLRITDVTNVSDPAFGSTPVGGFDLRAVSGPACLKYSHCAVTPKSDPSASDVSASYSLSLSHLQGDLVFDTPASFEEYGNGSARLVGRLRHASDPSIAFELVMSFSGRMQSPPQSPLLELKPSAYITQGGPIDPSTWYHYKQIRGTLIGKGAQSSSPIALDTTVRALQVGEGANGRNESLGARGTLTYRAAAALSTAELALGLTSCSTTPSTPTPQPTPPPRDDNPTCQKEDLSKTLATMDNDLRARITTINRAARLLLRNRRSKANVRFATEARAKAHNLYTRAWSDVWRHDRFVVTCPPSAACFDVHLEPSQAALATSAEALDATVERSLRYIERKVSNRRAKRALKDIIRAHTAQRRTFMEKLASLPGHSTRCA